MGKSTKIQIGFRVTAAQLATLERLAERYGGKQAVFDAALARLDGAGELTNAELAAIVAARLGETK